MGENIHGSCDFSRSFKPNGADAEFSEGAAAVSRAIRPKITHSKVTRAATPRSSTPIRTP
jgi:hypothetical protein